MTACWEGFGFIAAIPFCILATVSAVCWRANGKNDGRRGLDKFSRELAEQIEKYLSHPHENSNIMDGTSKPSAGDKQFLYKRIC